MMRQNPRIQGQDRGCELEPHEWRSKAPHAHAPLYRGAPLYSFPRRQRGHHFRDTEPRNILLNLQLHREIYKYEPQAAEHNNSNNNTKKPLLSELQSVFLQHFFDYWIVLRSDDVTSSQNPASIELILPPPPKKNFSFTITIEMTNHRWKSPADFFFFFFQPDSSGRMKWMLEWFSPRSQSDHGCEAAVFKGKSQLKSR